MIIAQVTYQVQYLQISLIIMITPSAVFVTRFFTNVTIMSAQNVDPEHVHSNK